MDPVFALATLVTGGATLEAKAGGEAIETGGHAVYTAVEGGIAKYVGITTNLVRRAGEHLAEKGISIEPIPGLTKLSKFDARAVEQVLIEKFGLGKNGGTLLNKINSIAPNNPIYKAAIQRGTELLEKVGFN